MGVHKLTYGEVGFETVLDFELWDGPPPPTIVSQLTTYARPGVQGAGAQDLGGYAQANRVTLTEHFDSFANAHAFILAQYAELPKFSPMRVTYNSIDYSVAAAVLHMVSQPEWIIASRLHLCGPGYFYPNGAAVRLAVTLTPVIP